jgi:hypothetical protein
MEQYSVAKLNPRVGLLLAILLALPVYWPSPAGAHEMRPAIATLELSSEATVSLTISLNLEAVIAGIRAGHDDTAASPVASKYERLRSLNSTALRAEFDRFTPDFVERINLSIDGEPVLLRALTVNVPPIGDRALARVSQLTLEFPAPVDGEALHWRVNPLIGDSVVRVHDTLSGEISSAEFVLAGETSGPISMAGRQVESWASVFGTYLQVGFTHIIPKGQDHILFVTGLFLLSTRLSALLWQVTAFTAAHTMTLALAMAGLVQLPPALVEPLIAASIVYVAIENTLTSRLHRWRLVVVFCFGLVHGLGFAGVLQEIGPASGQFAVSLLAFNLGVELGQLAVIAACFLCVGWMARWPHYRTRVVIPASLAIGIMGLVWFVQRVGLAL